MGGVVRTALVGCVSRGPAPVAQWNFDGTDVGSPSIAPDAIGSNDAALTGNYAYKPDGLGNNFGALGGTGTTAKGVVADDVAIQDIFDGGGRVTLRFNANSAGGGGGFARFIDKQNAMPIGWMIFMIGPTMKFAFSQAFSGNAGAYWQIDTALSFDTFYSLEVIYNSDSDANNPIIKIGGSAVAITEVSAPSGTRVSDVGAQLTIINASPGNAGFDGEIDAVKLYDSI